MTRGYCPERGDVVWLDFTPQAGHEQAGRRRPSGPAQHGVERCPVRRGREEVGEPFAHGMRQVEHELAAVGRSRRDARGRAGVEVCRNRVGHAGGRYGLDQRATRASDQMRAAAWR